MTPSTPLSSTTSSLPSAPPLPPPPPPPEQQHQPTHTHTGPLSLIIQHNSSSVAIHSLPSVGTSIRFQGLVRTRARERERRRDQPPAPYLPLPLLLPHSGCSFTFLVLNNAKEHSDRNTVITAWPGARFVLEGVVRVAWAGRGGKG